MLKIKFTPTTAGPCPPLTLERFRIVELYAELLHCSNMAIVNRPLGSGPQYDDAGRLLGGLTGLDELSEALENAEAEAEEKGAEEVVLQSAKELPISASGSCSTSDDEDEEVDQSSAGEREDEDEMEDIAVDDEKLEVVQPGSGPDRSGEREKDEDEPKTPTSPVAMTSHLPLPPTPSSSTLPTSAPSSVLPNSHAPSNGLGDDTLSRDDATDDQLASPLASFPNAITAANPPAATATAAVEAKRDASSPVPELAPGDLLKQKFIDHDLLPTLLVRDRSLIYLLLFWLRVRPVWSLCDDTAGSADVRIYLPFFRSFLPPSSPHLNASLP